jgi:hypothetical protein
MTLTAIALPNWVSFYTPLTKGGPTMSYGLHRACNSVTNSCRPFPQLQDCEDTHGYFCTLWRTTGFLMNFAAVLELVTIVTYIVVLAGGKQKRQNGWKVILGMLVGTGAVQSAAMALVVSYYIVILLSGTS